MSCIESDEWDLQKSTSMKFSAVTFVLIHLSFKTKHEPCVSIPQSKMMKANVASALDDRGAWRGG